jgi:dipeptidyl aminopeptidase/acylaminoacyl peptidase
MRKTLALLTILFAATTLHAQKHAITFEDLAAIKRVGTPRVSPDGLWVAYDLSSIDLGGNKRTAAIWLVPSAGGEARRITDGVKQDESPSWSPDGKSIAYVSNRESDPKQIYVYDIATAKSRKVTSLSGGAGSFTWLPDGSGWLVTSDVYPECGVDPACHKSHADADASKPSGARVITSLLYRHWKSWQDPTRTHIVFAPFTSTAATRDLTPGAFSAPPFSLGGGDEFDISPDGKELVYASDTQKNPETSTNSDLFLVALTEGTAKRITTRTGADTAPKYSPDGKYIAWRSQSRAGYESDQFELWLYDRATGTSSRLAAAFPNNVESMTWAPDSRSIFITTAEKAHHPIYEITLKDGSARQVWNDGSADALSISRDGKTIVFTRSSLETPSDVWAMSRTGAPRKLTTHNDALLQSIAMGATSDLWYTGADNAQVQALLVTPPNYDPTKKYPAIVLIHGGPQGNWAQAWSYRWNPQLFAARGYVVLMPNPRGSTGYGQKFVEEISRDWGGKVYVDLMNGVDKLAALPYVDANRLGAAGGSYGGYMVDWILGHSTRFKALVSHAGVYNLESMYGVTEELWFPEWEFAGNPWDNPELYEKWSPNKFVKNFATPTLVTHGELDFRVPINQGLELFTALQKRGIPSKLVYFPDEGHWILKPQNSKLWYSVVGDWFDQYLKP